MDADPLVPPVVAVVVASDPGPWFEETLSALGAQDYSNLSVLVIDAGGGADPTPLVAGVLPDAYARRTGGQDLRGVDTDVAPGWAAAANEVIGVVDGASHYFFCHDDAAADPDAIRLLVEEAFRSNAAVTGAKLVDWSDPASLRAVGLGADRLGAVHPLVEAGELDQAQHDAVRDVFAVPAAAMLVRADLFAALGGFDPALDGGAAELDLCWRAQLAGGRVIVAPAARVRHLEAARPDRPAARAGPEPAEHQRIRTLLVCAGIPTLLWLLPVAAVLLVAESLASLLLGRPGEAARRISGLSAPFRRPAPTWRARRRAQRVRQVPDRRLRRLQTPGNTRLRGWARRHLDDAPLPPVTAVQETTGAPEPAGMRAAPDDASAAPGTWRLALGAAAVLVVVFAVGSRSLLGPELPDVASLPDTSAGVGALWHGWLSTWQGAVLGRSGPASPALGLLALAGTLLFGAVGTLQHVLVLGPLVVGPLGAWRAARPWGSARGRVATMVAYALVPVGLDALSVGHWDGLIAYAAAPWLVAGLVRISDALPLPGTGTRAVLGRVGAVGLLTAVVAAFVPSWLLVVPVVAASLAAGSLLVGQRPVAVRLLAVGVAAGVVGAVLLLPWSLRVIGDPTTMFGVAHAGVTHESFGAVLHLHTGSIGLDVLGWGLLAAAALPLVIGRSWRLAWAARLWVTALVGALWAWAGLRGWVPMADPEVVLAPAAFALAASVGLGVVAFELDLPGYRFGWRQLTSAVAALGLVLAAVPVVGATGGGRWHLPGGGASSVLTSLQRTTGGDYRVLWIGAPDALPLASEPLGGSQAFATSFDGLPDVTGAWASGRAGGAGVLSADIRLSGAGLTTKLGHLLAAFGVRYLVLPAADGPTGTGAAAEVTSPQLARGLLLQTDLRPLTVDPSYTVYANQAWVPVRASVPASTAASLGVAGPAAARLLGGLDLQAAAPVLGSGAPDAASGPVGAGTSVYVAATPAAAWRLAVDGHRVAARRALGVGQTYALPTGGRATIVARTSLVWRTLQIVLVAGWVLLVAALVVDRRRRARHPDDPVQAEWFTPLAPSRGRRSRRTRAASTAPAGMDSDEVWIDA